MDNYKKELHFLVYTGSAGEREREKEGEGGNERAFLKNTEF
jgi:hypothetical protein